MASGAAPTLPSGHSPLSRIWGHQTPQPWSSSASPPTLFGVISLTQLGSVKMTPDLYPGVPQASETLHPIQYHHMSASPPGLLFRGLAPPSCQKLSTPCSPEITGVCALTSCPPPPRTLFFHSYCLPAGPGHPGSLSTNSLVSCHCQHLPKAFTPQNQVSRTLDEASRSFSILFPWHLSQPASEVSFRPPCLCPSAWGTCSLHHTHLLGTFPFFKVQL